MLLGTVLASWLGGTLDESLSSVIPDAQERDMAVEEIIDSAWCWQQRHPDGYID